MKLIAHRDHLRRAIDTASWACGGRATITKRRVRVHTDSGAAFVTGTGNNGWVESAIHGAEIKSHGEVFIPPGDVGRIFGEWKADSWTVSGGGQENAFLSANAKGASCCKEWPDYEWVTVRKGDGTDRVKEKIREGDFPNCPAFPDDSERATFRVSAADLAAGMAIAATAGESESNRFTPGCYLKFSPNRLSVIGFDGGPSGCMYGIETLHGNSEGLAVIESSGAKLLSRILEDVAGDVELVADGNLLHLRCGEIRAAVPQLVVRREPPMEDVLKRLPDARLTLPMADLQRFIRRVGIPLDELPPLHRDTASLTLAFQRDELTGLGKSAVGTADVRAERADGNHPKLKLRMRWRRLKETILPLPEEATAEVSATQDMVCVKSGRATVVLATVIGG